MTPPARSSPPEQGAQLRSAQARFRRSKDMMRGAELWSKSGLSPSRPQSCASAISLKNTPAQRDQALSAIKSVEAQVERIHSILSDLNLVSPRLCRVQYQLACAGEVIAAGAATD